MDRSTSIHCSNKEAMKRWICFIAAIWLQSISGTNFVFSNYSSDLKKVMGIDQIKLSSLAVASDLGKIMGWVSGLACMVLPTWAVLAIAMSLGTVGYGVQWLMLNQIIHPLAYWQVYILCFLGGNSICWFNTVSFKTAIENFPNQRGIASGLITSYSGLSAIIYTSLSLIVNPGHDSSYLLLNCIVPAIVVIISATLLHFSQSKFASEEKTDYKNMILFTVIAVATALCSILFEFLPYRSRGAGAIYMSVLIIFLLAPLYIPLKSSFGHTTKSRKVTDYSLSPGASLHTMGETNERTAEEDNSSMDGTLQKYNDTTETKDYQTIDIELQGQQQHVEKKGPSLGEEHNIRQLLSSISFWLYYFVYFCGGTVGLVYINNLGQILQSLGYTKTPVLVSLVSSFGFFGRIASEFPDFAQQWRITKTWPVLSRPTWIGIWMVPMAASFFMMALLNPRSMIVLYVSTAIIGASSGAITTIAIPTSSELFGLEHFGVNHNILISNIAFGSLLFGEIAGVFYDDSDQGQHVCMGKQCFHNTFVLWGCVCSFGIILCMILTVKTHKLYESIHRQH